MTFGRFIIGILGIIAGLLMLKYKEQVRDFLGNIDFANDYFGAGGTWTLVSIIGLLLPVLSVMYMFGTLQDFIRTILGPFF